MTSQLYPPDELGNCTGCPHSAEAHRNYKESGACSRCECRSFSPVAWWHRSNRLAIVALLIIMFVAACWLGLVVSGS